MLELLREEQCESQVTQQQDRQNQRDNRDDVNVHGGYLNFWQALT
jgi:hypothetical protein